MVKRSLALLTLVACGSASDAPIVRDDHDALPGFGPGTPTEFDAGPVVIPPEPLEPWDTTNAGPMTGIFAAQSIITAKAGVTVELRQLFRIRMVQHGTTIHQKTTLCAMKLPDVTNVAKLVIPPPLWTVIETKSVEVEGPYLAHADGLGPYNPPPFLLVLGAKLANPATDALPTMMDQSLAVDEDMDGHPGVTALATVVTCTSEQSLYVALRTSGAFAATVETPDLIDGKGDVKFEFSVLGYSDPCLAVTANFNIQIINPSPIQAKRVGDTEDVDHNGNVSCPEIQVNAPRLFGDYWNN
jgi:hypothetical protein